MTVLALGDTITADSTVPEGVAHGRAIMLDADGTRRVWRSLSWTGGAGDLAWMLAQENRIPIWWGPKESEIGAAVGRGSGYLFLPYPPADGVPVGPQAEPVNQIPYLEGWRTRHATERNKWVYHPGWRRHVCTFAHEISTKYADHDHQFRQRDSYRTLPDMPHNDESNLRNQNGLQYARGACGYNFDMLQEWAKMHGEDGGSGSIATDWKMRMPGIREDVEALCLECPHPYFLREWIIKHDPAAWRRALDELLVRTADEREFRYMRCPKTDRSSEPWQPAEGNIATFSGNAPLNWWKNQMENWGYAVDYFDAHYSSRDA